MVSKDLGTVIIRFGDSNQNNENEENTPKKQLLLKSKLKTAILFSVLLIDMRGRGIFTKDINGIHATNYSHE